VAKLALHDRALHLQGRGELPGFNAERSGNQGEALDLLETREPGVDPADQLVVKMLDLRPLDEVGKAGVLDVPLTSPALQPFQLGSDQGDDFGAFSVPGLAS